MPHHFSPRRQHGAALVNFLLLLIAAAVVAGGWFGWQQLTALQQQNHALQQQLDRVAQQQGERGEQQATRDAEMQARVDAIEIEQAARSELLDNLQRGGQRNWLLNEAEALANLAQQRLLLTADLAAAERLLLASDQTLARLHDSRVLPARKALAQDLDAVRAAQQVDVQALVLQLGALQQRVATLAMPVTAQQRSVAEKTPPDADAGWWQTLLYNLPVTVRREQAALPLPLDASQASSLRLYLDNCLQQAQLSLLQGKPESYRQALGAMQSALSAWLTEDSADSKHLQASIDGLLQQDVEQALPEIGGGLAAIRGLQVEFAQ